MIIAKENNWELIKKDSNQSSLRGQSDFFVLTKDIFDTCPFKEYIFNDYEILFIIIAGSALSGLYDEYSDWDLVVYTKEKLDVQSDYSLMYNNIHLHWYYRTLTDCIDIDSLNLFNRTNMFQYKNLTEKNLLYLNPKYNDTWNKLLANKLILSELYLEYIYTDAKVFYEVLINKGLDSPVLPLKFFHHILKIYSDLTNTPIDTKFLLRVKRMRYVPLSSDELALLKELLNKFLILLKDKKFNTEELKIKWMQLWA